MFYVQIGSDPTSWRVPEGVAISSVAQDLAQATAPVPLPVDYPLVGTLVVSARSAGTVLLTPPGPDGSHPSGARLRVPVIRVPSGVAATVDKPGGHSLAPGTNLAQLQQDIESAMTGGTILTLPIGDAGPNAALVLGGASLAYVILCPAS